MKKEELQIILGKHTLWREAKKGGKRADLSDADLSDADLRNANLRNANLSYANLRNANLRNANLSYANLSYADLSYADLSYADLSDADLSDADLSDADLSYANLSLIAAAQLFVPPESGSFEAWKSCVNGVLVRLLVPAEAKRSSATTRNCRAEFVDVLEVIGAHEGVSHHDCNVIYRKGETVHCDKWEPNRWKECAGGIHFFLTKEEAKAW